MNRFKLEDAIYYSDMSSDLEIAFQMHCDGAHMSQDDVDNMLMALWQISKLRQWKLEDTFKREFELDEYCTDPDVLKLRESVKKYSDAVKEYENKYHKSTHEKDCPAMDGFGCRCGEDSRNGTLKENVE